MQILQLPSSTAPVLVAWRLLHRYPMTGTPSHSRLQLSDQSQNQTYVTTDGQSAMVSSTHLGPKTRFLLLWNSCGFVDVRRPLWLNVITQIGPNRKHRFQQFSILASYVRCRRNVFIGHYLATAVSTGCTILVFQLPCHNTHNTVASLSETK
jgi:hypothetical protein